MIAIMGSSPVLPPITPHAIRDELTEMVVNDLLGSAGGPKEELDQCYRFHATKQGERYTLSETARRTVLDRLLALNHQRYAEEVKAGLHNKKAKGRWKKDEKKPAAAPAQGELLQPPQAELFS